MTVAYDSVTIRCSQDQGMLAPVQILSFVYEQKITMRDRQSQ
jgi:hypothetical protein